MNDAWKQRPLHAKSVPGVLTAEECDAIKSDALAVGMSRALVRTPKGMRKLRGRTCEAARLPRTKDREWLYERLMATNEAINAEYWRFALNSIEEVQVLRYKPNATLRLAFRYGARAGPQTHLRGQFVASPIPLARWT